MRSLNVMRGRGIASVEQLIAEQVQLVGIDSDAQARLESKSELELWILVMLNTGVDPDHLGEEGLASLVQFFFARVYRKMRSSTVPERFMQPEEVLLRNLFLAAEAFFAGDLGSQCGASPHGAFGASVSVAKFNRWATDSPMWPLPLPMLCDCERLDEFAIMLHLRRRFEVLTHLDDGLRVAVHKRMVAWAMERLGLSGRRASAMVRAARPLNWPVDRPPSSTSGKSALGKSD